MDKKKVIGVSILLLLFISGIFVGYWYFSSTKPASKGIEIKNNTENADDLYSLRMYYPAGEHLQIEERRLPRRTLPIAVAEAVVEQYLKGPVDAKDSVVPREVKILGIYRGADRILYVDLSEEFRKNFRGDAISEMLLLKGLYQSIISNIEEILDVKVLIEGKEVETLGGHFYLKYPLKGIVSYETS